MEWNKKISTILSLFFISSLMLLSFGYAINTTSNDINSQNNGLADSPWPRYRGNHQGTGLSPYNTSFVDGTEKWNITLDGSIKSQPVIGPNGTIYLGTDNRSLYAVNQDGWLKWKANLKGNISYPPSIGENGNIYVTLPEGTGEFCAFDENGERLWHIIPRKNDGNFIGSPVISSKGVIFTRTSESEIYAINPNGSLKWRRHVEFAVNSPLVIDSNDFVYYAYDGFETWFNAIYPNGTEKWKVKIPIPKRRTYSTNIYSPIISLEGTIYVLGADPGLDKDPYVLLSVYPNGTKGWRKKLDGNIYTNPTLGPKRNLYYGNSSGIFESVTPNGTKRWSIKLTGNLYPVSNAYLAPAAGTDGTVYVSTCSKTIGRFYGINSEGSIKWMISKNGNFTSPAIGSDGTVYVGNENGKLYALGPSSPTVDITRPTSGESMKTKSVKLEWDSASLGSDIDHFEVRLDDDDWQKIGSQDHYEFTDLNVGDHTAEVKAVAESNNYDVDSVEFTVEEDTTPPTADAGEDRTVKVDDEVIFDGSGSSDNREITSYEWDFDDGTTTDGKTVEHKFDEKGTYEVKLTVTDEAGNTDTDTVTVTVEKKDDNGAPGFTIGFIILSITLVLLYRRFR